MTTRICLAPGQWQIIMLASALRQASANSHYSKYYDDYLILYANTELIEERKDAMLKIALSVWKWKKIIWIDDLFDSNSDSGRYTISYFNKILVGLREKIGIRKSDQIWTCQLRSPLERVIVEAYVEADIVLYEDGLSTYTYQWSFPNHSRHPLELLKQAKHYLEQKIPSGRVYNTLRLSHYHICRISKIYLYLENTLIADELLQNAQKIIIEDEDLKNTINACLSLADIQQTSLEKFDDKSKSVLILGQCFAQGGSLEWKQELAIYCQIVDKLLNKKYQVIWKEHPRIVKKTFSQELSQIYSSKKFVELQFPFTLPIELVAEKIGISACVAASSTALFYLPKLYSIESYTFADYFIPYIDNQHSHTLNTVAKNIKSVSLI